VLVAGYLLYSAYLGFFAPGKLLEATLDFIKSNEQLAAPYQVPARIWLKTEPRIYGPVLACIGTVAILGRSILANTLRARIAQFAVAYTAIFWLYRFAMTSSVIETWWAYGMTAVTPAFAMPAMLDVLARREGARGRLVLGCALFAVAIADLVLRSATGTALDVFEYLRTHPWELLALLVLSCAAALAAGAKSTLRLRLVAFSMLCTAIAVLSLTPAHYLGTNQVGEFVPYSGETGLEAYQASHDVIRLIASKDHPSSRVLLWDELQGLANVGWANLPHRGGGIENVEAPTSIPQLTPSEVGLLHQPTTHYVLALSQYPTELAAALPALRAQQLTPRVQRSSAWVDGELHYQLIEVHSR
jgi:hypothetical protein